MFFSPKYSESYISKIIKGNSSKLLRKEHPHLKKWCGDHLLVPNCYHGYVNNVWDVVAGHNAQDIIGNNPKKRYTGSVQFVRGIP